VSRVDRFLQIPQVEVCFLCLPPGFPAVPQYFNRVSVGPGSSGWLLNQADSSDFAWRTKNSLWDELNVLKQKLNVKNKKTIADYRFKSSMLG
jgi:hypothetical protein